LIKEAQSRPKIVQLPCPKIVGAVKPLEPSSPPQITKGRTHIGREMGRSRRKYKNSRAKVQVGLPKRNPRVFKPAFNLPPKLRNLLDPLGIKWDEKGSVISNYKQFGVVSNPNFLGVRARTSHIIESDSLQVPPPPPEDPADIRVDEFEPIDSGSELEEDG